MLAVVRINGKQFTIHKGDTIDVERIDGEVGTSLTIDDVLLVDRDGSVEVGTPTLEKIKVTAKIVAQIKGEKVEVRRFRAKSRHRRKHGIRPEITKLQITNIS